MYGKGWVWILTNGGTSLNFAGDTDVNSTGQGFIGIAPESTVFIEIFIVFVNRFR